jgi:cellulose synthase/poly-beta-1,6-N-acetylglucosamine synthase-like glycosyltransferase
MMPENVVLPFISIVIPFVRDDHNFRLAVASAIETDYPNESKEIIVVFNGKCSLPDTVFQERMTAITCITASTMNAYAARNAGARLTHGHIILFTDADCVVDRQWARRLVLPLLSNNDIAAIYGNVQAHEPQTALEIFGNDHIFNHARRPFDYLIAGNCAIRKHIFEKLGGFDEMFLSGGDIDFSIRLKKYGLRCINAPQAVVYHKHRSNIRALFLQYRKYGYGWKRLYQKWGKAIALYPPFKRFLVAVVFLLLSLFHAALYAVEPKSIRQKALRFKFFFLAVMNLGLFVGYYRGFHPDETA